MTSPLAKSVCRATVLMLCSATGLLADDDLPKYQTERSMAGTISIWGPAHMSALARIWADGFSRVQPGMTVQLSLRGSDTAIPGLYSGQADIALLGRANNITDDNGFSRPMGYMPQRFVLTGGSLDVPGKSTALVVFVHRDNPIGQLTLAQLDAIFGHEGRRGLGKIRTWGELGLKGEWENRPIRLFGYDMTTGTGRFFAAAVLGDSRKLNWDNLQEFKDTRRADGSVYRAAEQIVDALQREKFGMAISCLCYERQGIKDIALAESADGPYVSATRETLMSREYPLARTTYAFIDRMPGSEISPKVREFLQYIFSAEGQADIEREGDYLPLPPNIVLDQLQRL